MGDRLQLFRDLKGLFNDYKKNDEGFNEKLNELDNLLIKVGNYQNSQKVVFIGRGGGRKSELVSELINFTMPDINLKNNKFIEYNFCELPDMSVSESFENSCLKINLPKSQNSILDEITILDTPYYNYSDDLDSEIVEKCKDANIFVLVLNAVGSIGDNDKKFLKRISKNTFVNRLVFIFTNMENVLESDLISSQRQHETNSFRIANEILRVKQTDIPTFFVRNNKLDTENFLPLLRNFNLTSDDKKYIWEIVLEILGNLQKLVEDEQIGMCKNKELVKPNKDCLTTEGISSYTNENDDLYSGKLELIKIWKDSKFKDKDFPGFSKFESKETKEEIEKKFEEIEKKLEEIEKKLEDNEYFTNKSEWECKIPQDITSIINEFLKLFDDLMNFTDEFDGDQFRFLPNKYNELVDFANGITDGKLFYLIRNILIDIELELILILIHFENPKSKTITKHITTLPSTIYKYITTLPSTIYQQFKTKKQPKKSIQTCDKRKEILRDMVSKISSADIKNEKRSAPSSNEQKHVEAEPISNQNNFVSNSDEILEKMLAIIKSLIHSDHNEIFVKEA